MKYKIFIPYVEEFEAIRLTDEESFVKFIQEHSNKVDVYKINDELLSISFTWNPNVCDYPPRVEVKFGEIFMYSKEDNSNYRIVKELEDGGMLSKEDFIACGSLTYELLEYLHSLIEPGITTMYLDECAVRWAKDYDCVLENYNYKGYPGHICVNVNEEVQHSIPGSRIIKDGDIVNIDLSVRFNGVVTDAARTWPVGRVDSKYLKFISYTEKAFKNACKILKPGVTNTELTKRIHKIADEHHYYPVMGFTGHGIGEEMHLLPYIANNLEDKVPEAILELDKAYCIEPIFMYKKGKIFLLRDGWTTVSEGIMHAQYEDTLYLVEGGYINVTNGSLR